MKGGHWSLLPSGASCCVHSDMCPFSGDTVRWSDCRPLNCYTKGRILKAYASVSAAAYILCPTATRSVMTSNMPLSACMTDRYVPDILDAVGFSRPTFCRVLKQYR